MNPETWARVKKILDACLDLEPAQWAHYLNESCAGDSEVRAEVESLLSSHEQAGDFIVHPALRESFVGGRLGHWKIVADIGEGGMSRVCLAERDDGQFEQRAAVKILKRGMDTDLVLRHFQMERQILAGMHHPHVARLLDGGVTPGGRPYFVMEHIEGQRIDEYAESKKLSPAGRLRLFQQVCSAVHYAHQRLVVHRDIKPSNILVTPDGTAKLLDFGIATILSPERALGTLSAAQMLTPDYASPEQIRGEPVTTHSDVYSLGVLLYKLLTGLNPHSPANTSPHELARAICERDPHAPSTVVRQEHRRILAGDLDNIVLKAMERDPQQRYASAEQLSQDIRHYLEGRPVLARPHTWRYRASKFVMRNKLAVAGATTIVFLLAGGMAATLWQARIARMERERAEQQFFETRQLANTLLFEVHDAIKDLPGSTKARAFLIQRSLKYLDRISAASPGNAALQLELAEGYKRLGDVQGKASDAHLGEYASATKSYAKALALLKSSSNPVLDRQRRRLMAMTQLRFEKLEETEQAIQILESLRDTGRGDTAPLGDLAAGYGSMADLMVERRELPKALEFRVKEWTLQKQILEKDSRNIVATRNYALASKKLGGLLWKLGRLTEARGYYQTALRLEEGWAALDPSNTDAKAAISYSHSDIGFMLREEKKPREALEHYRTTVKIREELAAMDPNNARAKLSLVSAYWRTASVSVVAGDRETAWDLLAKAVRALAQSKSPAPGSKASRAELANVYSVYGESHAAGGDRANARLWYERSKKVLTDLHASGELDANGADVLASLEKELAKLGTARKLTHVQR
ncbi:MAG: serine/threonine protein kinase [Acidobacteria bacterium]|nr:serine/threonine protein kinase [Acidobacteriota bacterium]